MDEALVRILADHELKHQEIRSIEDLQSIRAAEDCCKQLIEYGHSFNKQYRD
jgi:hypothetical protein